jgi:hypothetical protein
MISCLADNPQCVEGLRLLISHIPNNQLPEESRDMLTSSTLVPLTKVDNGVRPIAISELFYRIAAKYAMSLIADQIDDALGHELLGINEAHGCAKIVHLLQYLLTQKDDELACLDIECPMRSMLLKEHHLCNPFSTTRT